MIAAVLISVLAPTAPAQDAPGVQDGPNARDAPETIASGVDSGGVHWPSFRGLRAGGVVAAGSAPTAWNVETGANVAWETPIPGLAHSSPVVWGPHLFVTTAERSIGDAELSSLYGSEGYGAGEAVPDEGAHEYHLYCLDKRTGEVLWRRTPHAGVPRVKRHPKATHANSTPTVDAEHVVAFFGSEGLYCYDHDGLLVWKKDLGLLESGAPRYSDPKYHWGFASSPVIHAGRVLVQCDVWGLSFLAAFDLRTGRELWRAPRQEDCTWSTPTVVTGLAGGDQVVLNGYEHTGAYDLETGREVWKLSGGGDVPVPTPVTAGGTVYLTSAHGRMRPIYAVDASAQGEVVAQDGDERMRWFHARRGIYMQTPIALAGRLYCCSDGGVLGCYDLETGREIYRERLGAGGAGFSASAVAVGGVLYFTSESGEVHLVRPGDTFDVLGVLDLGENCLATPAVSEGALYFRTRSRIVAIAEGD